MLRGILLFVLGIGIVAAGVVGYQLYTNANATPAGGSNANARNQFLSDRGGAAAPVTDTTGTGGQGGGFAGGGRPGVAGTVESVASDTLKVKSAADSSTITVHLAANAPIRKQMSGQASDIKVGDQIFATGSQNGDKFAATMVQIGGAGGFGGGFGGFGGQGRGPNASGTPGAGFGGGPGRANASGTPFPRGQGATGTPGAGRQGRTNASGTPFARAQGTPGAGGGFPFNGVAGSVTAVNGSTITVQEQTGTSVALELGTNTQIRVQQTIALTDVKAGDTVLATGAQNGDTFEATALQVGVMQIPGAPTATP